MLSHITIYRNRRCFKMYLISVYFDTTTTKRLQSLICQIAAVSGNTYMTQNHVPPHLTLSAVEARNVEVLLPPIQALEGKLSSGKVQFVSVGQLLPYVLFLAPVLNSCLMDLAQQVYNAISPIADTKISKYYRPFSWLPHITLGKTLSTEEMQCAFAVVQSHFSVFDGFVTEIGVAKVNPHIDVLRYRLQ